MLREDQVRWFNKATNTKRWTPFDGYDSLNLEKSFRNLKSPQFLTSPDISWPNGINRSTEGWKLQDLDGHKSGSFDASHAPPLPSVPVLGGLYEVDLSSLCCKPIYWKDDNFLMKVLRGVWFRDGGTNGLDPIDDEIMVRLLESEHAKLHPEGNKEPTIMQIQPSGHESRRSAGIRKVAVATPRLTLKSTASAPVLCGKSEYCVKMLDSSDNKGHLPRVGSTLSATANELKRKPPFHTLCYMDYHVDWYEPDEVYLYQDSTAVYIQQKLGIQKVGTRLYRGYNQEAKQDDRLPDITHLCFVIHGIGQKMGTTPIQRSCADLRETCAKLKAKYFPHLDQTNQRVEFLPVEWRCSLHLDGDTVDSITPIHVRNLRTTLNSSAMDIMYYTSPLYRAEISCYLLNELNRLYKTFCTRNPDFESRGGKVSLIAHSLGCVLVYDLITGWSRPIYNQADQATISRPSYMHFIDSTDGVNAHNQTDRNRYMPKTSGMDSDESNNPGATKRRRSSHPDPLADWMGCGFYDSPSQNLRRVALLGQHLESAKIIVSRLEQELVSLTHPRDKLDSLELSHSNKQLNLTPTIKLTPETTDTECFPESPCSYFGSNSLLFKSNLANFFCLGSPLAVFMALRGIRPGPYVTQDNILPRRLCPRIFNIYHPADPVAYRLEPLVLKHYSSIRPVLVHRADASEKPDYDDLPIIVPSEKEARGRWSELINLLTLSSRQSAAKADATSENSESQQQIGSQSGSHGSFASRVIGFLSRYASEPVTPTNTESPLITPTSGGISDEEGLPGPTLLPTLPSQKPTEELVDDLAYPVVASTDSTYVPLTGNDAGGVDPPASTTSLRLEHRLDFELRSSRYENVYISILTSHSNYWTNSDVAMLIMNQLFGSSIAPQSSI
ncbi:unnamed protein product [Calicophoron daubneyi]|uniref:DDHD domain-containing protein n=1 Tax=Calicophoron daubneyi TaxID=300641 RepID=A0AAV2TA97_CALDB